MTFQKKVKVISLLAASSLTFLTGNSLKASEEYPTGMYGTISLGAGKVSHFDDQLGTDIDYAYDLFYELGLGYDFGKNFRTDISYIRGRTELDGKESGINDGDTVTKGFMLTGYIDFPIENTKWEPFIGLGIGSMEMDATENCDGAATSDCTDDAFTYSISGGVNYAINPSTSISAKITYMDYEDIVFTNGGATIDNIEYSTLSAYTGLKFNF